MHLVEGPIRKRASPPSPHSASNLLHCSAASHEWRLFKVSTLRPGEFLSRNFLGSRAPLRSIPSSPCRPSRRFSRSFLSGRRSREGETELLRRLHTQRSELLRSFTASLRLLFLWCCRPPSPTAGLVLHASEERRGLVSWPCSSSHVARFCSVIISSEALI